MAPIDYAIVGLYFVVVIGLGFWYRRRAARNLEAYFLGGKRLHWLGLAMSGSVSNFDITGTMWIVSMLFVLGMRSMWIHWMWGCMMGAFCLAYMGKWTRRSGVMTGAEWMLTRFGTGTGGVVARLAAALLSLVTLVGMIGYAFQGIGKFAAVYLNLPPNVCALLIIGTTTLYVLLGGLYSVVVTDVIQTIILTVASLVIGAIAYVHVTPEVLAETLPGGWESLAPVWRLEELAGTANAQYEMFGLLVILWVVKGLLLNAGGPGQTYDFQRFLAARDPRDAAKIGAAWNVFMVVRWGMAMGIVLLALTGIAGIDDPERVMPVVLNNPQFVPTGVRGFILAGLLAAFMSTFSSTVNGGASYLVRDLYQPLVPHAGQRHLVRSSYVATVLIVVVGIVVGFQAKSIAQIWNWLMMALGAGMIVPNVLRWYWWRFNGWGYAAGTVGGILLSLVALLKPDAPMQETFPPIVGGSLLVAVVVTLLTRPVSMDVLTSFYRTVRPFGAWGAVRARADLTAAEAAAPSESIPFAALNTGLGIVAISGLYLFPMYLVGHWHMTALLCFGAAALAAATLYVTWYRRLPAAAPDPPRDVASSH
jgi:SSS family solute:Na+ symporter